MSHLIATQAQFAKVKQNGVLAITADRTSIQWTSSVAGVNQSPSWSTLIDHITHFQQSPASSAKASIKISVQTPGGGTAAAPATPATPATTAVEDYVFRFTSATRAKEDKEAIVTILSEIIAAKKKSQGQGGGGNTSSAVASRSVSGNGGSGSGVVSTPSASNSAPAVQDMLADSVFLSDLGLQKSLLSKDAALGAKFNQMITNNPSLTPQQFSAQFWSSRIHLLRSHAAENKQTQGPYHVLSRVKKTTNHEGVASLNLSKEQISLIFSQHPIVRKIYDNLVPNQMESISFWSKFFGGSRLFKKLKGERIDPSDPSIPELDRYIDDQEISPDFQVGKVPRFMDLEGNQQDHKITHGNRPDETMRPSQHDKVPILRALNAMSEKMMANVTPFDNESLYNPAGVDEKTFEETRLNDLRAMDQDNRVRLNVTSQQVVFSNQDATRSASRQSIKRPTEIMEYMRDGFESDEEDSLAMPWKDSTKLASSAATRSILTSIRQNAQTMKPRNSQSVNMAQNIKDEAAMTHNTTVEFLHYFWTTYLSGDESRAGELVNLANSLTKSRERIHAVADNAEAAREKKLKELQEKMKQYAKATGKRMKINSQNLGPGKDVVLAMLEPTERAVGFAEKSYKKTYQEQLAAAQLTGNAS